MSLLGVSSVNQSITCLCALKIDTNVTQFIDRGRGQLIVRCHTTNLVSNLTCMVKKCDLVVLGIVSKVLRSVAHVAGIFMALA